MEASFPFILQNLHRIFLYLQFIPLFFLWLDAFVALHPDGAWRLGLGNVILFADLVLLTGYSLSCHSLRHFVGGQARLLLVHGPDADAPQPVAAADRPERQPHPPGRLEPARRRDGRPVHPAPGDRAVQRPLDPAVNDGPERHPHDVLVIGAGGAGLRAAIEAAEAGADVGLVCKSLLGKAHTVMAEGGVAAALGNVAEADSWQVHFRDTMVGGKLLNNPRMAQLHAQEAPDRVRELEAWGAVFDRTRDGRILQRPFGGHSHPRLAHVGDRTGLEMIRTLQDRAVAAGIKVYMECTITHLLTWTDRVRGAVGYWRTTGQPVVFPAKAIVLATGGIGRAFEITSNSWEYSGDGHALAYLAGAELIDMEFVQFHPTGMVWPPGVRGLLVTEAVRGEGGILRNATGERFMWRYLPEDRRARVRGDRRGGVALGRGRQRRPDDRRPPAARAVDPGQRRPGDLHARSRRAAARRTAGSSSTSATCRPSTSGASCRRCTSSSRSWPTSTSPRARWRSARRPIT